jgi:hypothetical protein
MVGLKELYDQDNLARAWRWIRSNSDAMYKGHFREQYAAYSIADEVNLKDLATRLKKDLFRPSEPCKLFLPKPSGILRPYTLLCVDDQIVYQAAVNVIAEQLAPRVRARYNVETFGHLYAGKTSGWFYQKWSKGYAAYNQAARTAFDDGYVYSASFDLTACYDSLDHNVLTYFLKELKLSKEFCERLTSWLSAWTAARKDIFLHHGIPQGPLSSGLLSEVVLSYFDSNRDRSANFKYFRYVDDIKIFGKDEQSLRSLLVQLDRLCKDIGLFPQSSKIKVHKVTDIEAELKSVSSPTEASISLKAVNQRLLKKRIREVTANYEIKDPTRFKYLLAHCAPEKEITKRIMRLWSKEFHLYPQVCRYLRKYPVLPDDVAEVLIDEVWRQKAYPSIAAECVRTLDERVPTSKWTNARYTIRARWKNEPNIQPDARAAFGVWLLKGHEMTNDMLVRAFAKKYSWWPKAELLLTLTKGRAHEPVVAALLNGLVRKGSGDGLARIAAYVIAIHDVPLETKKASDLNRSASLLLASVGLVGKPAQRECGINQSMQRMFGPCKEVDWKKFFGKDYAEVERHAIQCRAYADTSVTAWVNAFDVFCDWLFVALYRNNPVLLGSYTKGKVGSVLSSPKLRDNFPAILAMVKLIHENGRYHSNLSHAEVKNTGKPTRPIKYNFFTKSKPVVKAAFAELTAK